MKMLIKQIIEKIPSLSFVSLKDVSHIERISLNITPILQTDILFISLNT